MSNDHVGDFGRVSVEVLLELDELIYQFAVIFWLRTSDIVCEQLFFSQAS